MFVYHLLHKTWFEALVANKTWGSQTFGVPHVKFRMCKCCFLLGTRDMLEPCLWTPMTWNRDSFSFDRHQPSVGLKNTIYIYTLYIYAIYIYYIYTYCTYNMYICIYIYICIQSIVILPGSQPWWWNDVKPVSAVGFCNFQRTYPSNRQNWGCTAGFDMILGY